MVHPAYGPLAWKRECSLGTPLRDRKQLSLGGRWGGPIVTWEECPLAHLTNGPSSTSWMEYSLRRPILRIGVTRRNSQKSWKRYVSLPARLVQTTHRKRWWRRATRSGLFRLSTRWRKRPSCLIVTMDPLSSITCSTPRFAPC